MFNPAIYTKCSQVQARLEMAMSKSLVVLSLMAATVLYGCSSPTKLADAERDRIAAEQLRQQEEARRTAARQTSLASRLERVPQWAKAAPKPDADGVYAVGTGQSETLSLAGKKAMLDGEFGLAKVIGQEISGSERAFTQESNNRSGGNQFTSTVQKLVSNVPVVGYEVVNSEVIAVDGAYVSWVLLRMPYDSMNRVVKEAKADSGDARVTAAFDDLERRIAERKAQRTRDEVEQQRLRLEELRARQQLISTASQTTAPAAADTAASAPSADQAGKR